MNRRQFLAALLGVCRVGVTAVARRLRRAGRIHYSLGMVTVLDRDGLEHYRKQVERLLNRLTLEAEAWAESGGYKLGEQPVRREHPRLHRAAEQINRASADLAEPAAGLRLVG